MSLVSHSSAAQAKSIEDLQELFKPFDIRYNPDKYRIEHPPGTLRKASVLIPLLVRNEEYYVILTKRSDKLTHHAGLVAFPGGMADDTDKDEIHTALREANEEIGMCPNDVTVIGVFSPNIVRPNSLVYSVLGIVKPDFVPKINEKEVSFLFELPLKRFLTKERLQIQNFQSPFGITYHVYHFIDSVNGQQEVDTWGFTATNCIMTALGVYQTDDTFNFMESLITNKDNIFNQTSTLRIIKCMSKLTANL